MLKDEVKFLHEMADGLGIEKSEGHLQTSDYLEKQTGYLLTECIRIKKTWSGLLFSQTKDYVIRRYIWFQQRSLLDLADRLYEQIKQHKQSALQSGEESILNARSFLLEHLLDLNHFLVHYFNSYINPDVNIPNAFIPQARKRLRQASEQLSDFLKNVELDDQLKACILDYLQENTASDSSAPITYRSWEYLLKFTESLSVIIDFEDNRNLTGNVTEILFYLNFNRHSFCQWYQENLARKKTLLKPNDQVPMLKKQLLALKTMPVKITMSYDPELLPVNILLENWLNEYIKDEHPHLELLETDLSQKIELRLTVAQLALLIRLLYEEGVFATKNIASLLKFFSRHFMSKKQEHISYGSMNKLYYSGDQFTGYAVRALLLKMIVKINKMFFPA